jgi:hypothetical protein
VNDRQRTQQRAASLLSCAGDLLLVCVCHDRLP